MWHVLQSKYRLIVKRYIRRIYSLHVLCIIIIIPRAGYVQRYSDDIVEENGQRKCHAQKETETSKENLY